jgi:predicted peptidase
MSARFVAFVLFIALVSTSSAGGANDEAILNGFSAYVYQSSAGLKLPYRLFIPRKRDEALPLILYLHGRGGAGTDNRKQISGGNTPGTHAWIEPSLQERYPAFVLAPQIPEGSTWHTTGDKPSLHIAALIDLLDELRADVRIDARRIYVVGQSLGGYGAWDLIGRYPHLFAAAIPLCGGGDTKRIPSARDVAVWAFHGAKDSTVPVARSREMVDALRTVSSSVKYTEYPNVGHDVWNYAFKEPDLPEWLFAQRQR